MRGEIRMQAREEGEVGLYFRRDVLEEESLAFAKLC